jgi:RNA polymerase sigma-70 factor (ECF subfamily)
MDAREIKAGTAEVPSSVDSADSGLDPVASTQDAYITLLFNKYRAPLFRYLSRFVPRDDANELVQETYFRVMRHGNTVQLEAMARSFLFQTATNLMRDHHRRQKARFAGSHLPLDSADEVAADLDPSDQVSGEQTLKALEIALKAMPEEMRRIFLLYRFRDMSYADIGSAMGLSTRTIARRVSEAMDRLGSAVRNTQ